MKKFFVFFVMASCSYHCFAQSSIYSLKIDSANAGSQISLATYQGKKILIVNMASQDSSFNQYQELQQLALQYEKTLVVIVVPSNSFGNDLLSGISVSSSYTKGLSPNFIIASSLAVKGVTISPLYAWLTNAALNGAVSSQINAAGYKYLLNEKGNLVGVFTNQLGPFNSILTGSINNSY